MAQVATPTFTPTGGKVGTDSTFALACATEGAAIYYTYGTGTPTTLYSGAVSLPTTGGQTVNVRAYATKAGSDASEVATATFYTIGYSAAVDAGAPAVLDTSASQGLGAVCEAIGLTGADGASVTGASYIGGASAPLVFETNVA